MLTGKSLTGQVAIVTGASRGIGKAVAQALAAEGATVIINYNGSAEAAEAVATDSYARYSDICVYLRQ